MKLKIKGIVVDLFISKDGFDGRIEEEELVVDESGVFVDKFYAKDVERSVLVTSINSYKIVEKENISIVYGDLCENILVDFDLNLLKDGTQLQIGDVILEITQKCTICDHLNKIDNRVPALLEHDRGVFAKVIQGGIIKKGSTIGLDDKNNG